MDRFAALCVAGLLTAALTGCMHIRAGIYNVAADAQDLVRADLSFSFGTDMGAHVMVTKLAQLKSYSYEDLYRLGFGTRFAGMTREDREDWWVGPRYEGNMRSSTVFAWSGLPLEAKMRQGRWGAESILLESPDEVGAGFHLFVIGARAGVRPWELIDLLANLIGLDPCHDNLSWNEWQALRAAAKAARAKAAESKAGP